MSRPDDVELSELSLLRGKSCDYKVKKLIGQGVYGKVVCCIRLDNLQDVAVKVVRRSEVRAAWTELAALERILSLNLYESNLVRFYEAFMHRGHMCLVLEMLDMNLFDLMKQREDEPLGLSEIRLILQQMLEALNELKNIGLLHADIKPDNVMLVNHPEQPFRVKLIDFGLAIPVSELRSGVIIQPCSYRAPEVFLGLPLNEAVDMWSLGCVGAYLYLGQRLYPCNCEYEAVRVITQIHGLPGDHLLEAGLYSHKYFQRTGNTKNRKWMLKTRSQYTKTTGKESQQVKMISDKYTCLDHITQDHMQPETDSEQQDTQAFVSLLKRMLQVDPAIRIIPTEGLKHRFIPVRQSPRYTVPQQDVTSSHTVRADPEPRTRTFETHEEVSVQEAPSTSPEPTTSAAAGSDGPNDSAERPCERRKHTPKESCCPSSYMLRSMFCCTTTTEE
ncbi:homeodomain-interacting protein kinase 1-like [Embiotoca jacksoni]|uniref:homeodomain-interacting protein kinase 1-like n=1 Tax=Embiotoca jacksoni TaxID=100190 RepID=UPI003704D3F4